MRLPLHFAITVLAAAGMTLNANAVVLQFFGEDDAFGSLPVPNSAAAEASFLSNLTGVGTENFDSAPLGSANGFVSNFTGAGTATFTGDTEIISGSGAGRFPISGLQYMEGSANNFNISFSTAIAAFGFYATDVGDFQGILTLTYASSPATVIDISQQYPTDGNAFFFGYINTDNPFTGVTFSNSSAGADFFGFDKMTIGSVEQVTPSVPDAGTTVALLAIAFSGMIGLRKKFSV